VTIQGMTDPPASAPAGTLRRSLRLEEQLTEAHQSQAQVLLTGSGVNDFFITRAEHSRRLTAFLHGYCEGQKIGYVRYSMAEGVSSYRTLPGDQAVAVRGTDADMHPAQVVRQVLADLRAGATPAMFAFDYADGILGPSPDQMTLQVSLLCEQLQTLTADTGWHKAGLRLVMIDRGGGISPRLAGQPGIRIIHIGPPEQAELTIFARRAARATATAPLYLDASLSEEEAGRRARGLLNLHLHEMRLASSPERPVTSQQIADLKATAIRDTSGGTLELMPSRVTFTQDVAGLPAVRLALDDAQRANRTTLRILLAGPPGTGKTLAATAIAAALNVPAVRYGEILNEYVGVAERNMARANQILRAMAPLVLFIDEADQVGLGARGNMARSSEVHQNLRASLFEFLGDTGEQTGITVVATTNVPMQLDDAALSRFTVLPVLFASAAELVQIMTIHARRLGITPEGDLARVMTGYTVDGGVLSGRSAVQLLEAAHVQALRASSPVVSAQHVRGALDGWIGSDWTPAAEYSTLSSLLSARHADAWPWVAASRLGEGYELPVYLQPYRTGTGEIDVGQMRKRLTELGADHIFSGHG
jgi:transitional endoplasmic reticulum ATPase